MRISLPSTAPTQSEKLACSLKPCAIDLHFPSFGVGMNLSPIASQTAMQTVRTHLLAVQVLRVLYDTEVHRRQPRTYGSNYRIY
jgi:hypothetical protein